MKSKFAKGVFSLLLAGMLVLTGCGAKTSEGTNGNTTPPAETTEEGAEIAIVLKTLANPFWVEMKEGIEAEAEALGIKVDIYAAQSEDDLQGQLNLVETAISKNYKAIGIAPLSPANLNNAIAEANKKGIYVGNIDEKIDVEQLQGLGGSILFFVTTDNVAVGAKAADFIVEKNPEGGKVAIIEGKAGNASGNDRRDGATGVFKANDKFELVDSQPADWDRAKALDVATNMITKNPDLVAIYACNDTMALGAQQAVENAGKKGQIMVVGTDGAPEAIESIQADGMAATVAQDPAEIGAESLRLLHKALQDKPAMDPMAIPEATPVESNLITKE